MAYIYFHKKASGSCAVSVPLYFRKRVNFVRCCALGQKPQHASGRGGVAGRSAICVVHVDVMAPRVFSEDSFVRSCDVDLVRR